jgi:hypothetical protein
VTVTCVDENVSPAVSMSSATSDPTNVSPISLTYSHD